MTEQLTSSSPEQATPFNSGDQLDFHVASQHVKPYEAPKEATIVPPAETNKVAEHEQVARIGKYVARLRQDHLDLADRR